MEVFESYYSSPIGTLQIQCTNGSITSILFIDQPNTDIAISDTHPLLKECTLQLNEYFSGYRKHFDFPIHQEGTAFQSKVWNLLNHIPYGKTLSYMDLAKQYGDAKAIRAVASANGKNNLAIVVPCHRVIGSNATLTGYAGGLWRKKWLLDHEAKHHLGVQELVFG